MAWGQSGDKPLSEPMMVSLLTHTCVTRSQWVNSYPLCAAYMRQWIGSALVQIMASRLCGARPLSKPMLCLLSVGPARTILIKIQIFLFKKIHMKILSAKRGPFLSKGRWVDVTIALHKCIQDNSTISKKKSRECVYRVTTRDVIAENSEIGSWTNRA